VTQVLPEPIQFGKYTLYERIGRGGMADVFKGRIQGPAGFERVFVVKRILPHLSDDPAFIQMFVEEAKLSARLSHPNIVQIFELGSVEGEYFISMEHVAGHDLAETMRALWKVAGPPRPDLVAYIGREICRALAYAHGLGDEDGQPLGIIHRDVSPSNVMLSYEGTVKLLDFGIAKALGDTGEAPRTNSLKGKYAYMAPEQTESDHVDHRIDIFATGIVLHEVLTGRRLFKGANDLQTIERVRRCEIRPPSQHNPACPPELDAAVMKALARDKNDRFQAAAEMADALDDIVHAARFTPQHLAVIVRDLFGGEGTGTVDRRNTSSSIPVTASGSGPARSPTIPPVPATRSNTQIPVVRNAAAAAALKGIMPKPLWKRGSFWAVATLCAAGIGVAVAKQVGVRQGALVDGSSAAATSGPVAPESNEPGSSGSPSESPAPTTRAGRGKRVKAIPVLVQSEPEGAEIYVTGKLESMGKTPKWLALELDGRNPTRVMLRKPGFQDKAVAVENDRPPVVSLIPVGADPNSAGDAKARPKDRKPKK
jgi:serine/threonine protein kinase